MRSLISLCAMASVFLGDSGFAVRADDASQQKPASPAVGDMTLHIIPQSHIDLAWWWRYDPESLHIIAKHTLDVAFGNMEKFPDYTFTYLQVPAVEPLETLYPDMFYKLRYYSHNPKVIGEGLPNPGAGGAKGRLAIGSASWCEFDGCVPCGESLVRHFLYGKRYFLDNFGIDVRTAWVQDAWTHPWTLPQIMKKCGVDYYMFTRPRGEGDFMFWWESPDGSRVFAYKPLEMKSALPSQQVIDQRLLEVGRRYGVRDGMVMVGPGNHGGGAIRADVERMRNLMAQRESSDPNAPKPPKMIFSTPSQFVDAVLSSPHPFPVVKNELEPTIRGAYTSIAEIKKGNRRSESLLMTLEKFSAIAARLGERPYPQETIFDAWKKVMLNQFHDTISGTEIPPAAADAIVRCQQIARAGQAELQSCLKAICTRIDTQGPGTPVVVFNPLAWNRTDAVEVELECATVPTAFQLVDKQGNRVAAQIVADRIAQGKHRVAVAFVAEGVPSLGYKSYWIAPVNASAEFPDSPRSAANELENAHFRVQIDPTTGCVKSIFDKEQRREVLAASGKGNLIQVLEDFGDSEGFLKSADGKRECNDWQGKCWDVDSDAKIAAVEAGPVRATIEIQKRFDLARFTQRVTLYRSLRKIDFDLAVDWVGANKMVKVSFPLAISSPEATYEIPYGAIRRPSLGHEQAAQNWVDVSAEDYGVSLLNDSRYGYDVAPNVIRLSVLRSPNEPVSATDERERHTLRYAIYPHRGGWQGSRVVHCGHELNSPLIAVSETPHGGPLPGEYSFVRVEPENVVLSVLKKAEDGDHLIARCYEAEGKAAKVMVRAAAPLGIEAVHRADLLEKSERDVPTAASAGEAATFSADVPAWSIETYKLIEAAN